MKCIFLWKNKRKKYHFAEFFDDKDEAVREFLHYARDHYQAANLLIKSNSISVFDSAAYLYHQTFEMLFKGLTLYNFDEFQKTHDLLKLSSKLNLPLSNEDRKILTIINSFQHIKYPMDTKSKTIKVNKSKDEIDSHYRGEVGDNDFELTNALFKRLWEFMLNNKSLSLIISNIDFTKKGGRQLMRKPK